MTFSTTKSTHDSRFIVWHGSPVVGSSPIIPPDTVKESFSSCDVNVNRSSTEIKFLELVHVWHKERGQLSSPIEMMNCPSYKKIIAMGDTAIPFIIDDLKNNADNPDFWFMALREITGVDPIPLENHGDMKAMARVWVNWGERNGWLG